jgi:hypothetical protein
MARLYLPMQRTSLRLCEHCARRFLKLLSTHKIQTLVSKMCLCRAAVLWKMSILRHLQETTSRPHPHPAYKKSEEWDYTKSRYQAM